MRHIQRLRYTIVLRHENKLSSITVEATSNLEAGQEAVAEWQRRQRTAAVGNPKIIMSVKLHK